MNLRSAFNVGFGLLILLLPTWLNAQELTLFSLQDTEQGQDYNVKLQILLMMTVLSLIPALLMVLTSFTRIIVVLAILRQAMGLQQSPPNRVLIGIALMLTMLIMRPVWQDIYQNAYKPFQAEEMGLEQALARAEQPLRAFMLKQTRESELHQVLLIANEPTNLKADEIPFEVLMPAFVLSELTTAFQIGFMLFIPFLIIDLVVASVLMSMGMMMLSPLIISLPFKLMVFVLADGWSMVAGTLAATFGGPI
ncbi:MULTISPECIES: flagellar type III secretion system pore protein FliP [Pseudoalteromonas]|jgi:flagellar biosynthetic protein FliP|uniref:flagellar type III secretion system pore protein FliP n=1 Tax=Pseudoalteromonas TaxID=53246 RepID=UPI000780C816|nr:MULTISPECIES: flagellar type III secretion system pore protein FliP [Gammaproteobacteria]MCF7500699.1 flagellar type III secretion system pore protein FliP [Pseudoalteromonas sp. L1]RZF92270.1 flagellar biosynthesis protein FliP [Pseudoalteromonas sp. CO302Y]RZG08505.1 flagellar biosynthesis protein FliP [Pseudoalteromonas sp. CO133X]UJX26366.1 flagellar type III secretion system pore protein FliP [Pseudoalteromonas sp. CF6-2]WOC27160.1 flagellar type III secretion system pore protein FliP |tara:strand:- start:461 stop:1213 length:753 start_codon:yes stop_codon:yes gene_type:complete